MAWTTPKTWSVGETLTAANFNTHIRDNLSAVNARFHIRKTSDESVNSAGTGTTLQNDDALLFALAASEVWAFEAFIMVNDASSGTADVKFTFTVPAGATGKWTWLTAGPAYDPPIATAFASVYAAAVGSSANDYVFQLVGTVVNSVTPGNLQFQWAQNVSNASNVTVKANSWLIGEKIA